MASNLHAVMDVSDMCDEPPNFDTSFASKSWCEIVAEEERWHTENPWARKQLLERACKNQYAKDNPNCKGQYVPQDPQVDEEEDERLYRESF